MHTVILAAGEGKRMGCGQIKVLTPFHGKSILSRILEEVLVLMDPSDINVIVNKKHMHTIQDHVQNKNIRIITQGDEKGTAKAVEAWTDHLDDDDHPNALILPGDIPLISSQLLRDFIVSCEGFKAGIMVFHPQNTKSYGRVFFDQNGHLCIREHRDCSMTERHYYRMCNTGIYMISSDLLRRYLPLVENKNQQSEYYLTDVMNMLAQDEDVNVYHVDRMSELQVQGVNTMEELRTLQLQHS